MHIRQALQAASLDDSLDDLRHQATELYVHIQQASELDRSPPVLDVVAQARELLEQDKVEDAIQLLEATLLDCEENPNHSVRSQASSSIPHGG